MVFGVLYIYILLSVQENNAGGWLDGLRIGDAPNKPASLLFATSSFHSSFLLSISPSHYGSPYNFIHCIAWEEQTEMWRERRSGGGRCGRKIGTKLMVQLQVAIRVLWRRCLLFWRATGKGGDFALTFSFSNNNNMAKGCIEFGGFAQLMCETATDRVMSGARCCFSPNYILSPDTLCKQWVAHPLWLLTVRVTDIIGYLS